MQEVIQGDHGRREKDLPLTFAYITQKQTEKKNNYLPGLGTALQELLYFSTHFSFFFSSSSFLSLSLLYIYIHVFIMMSNEPDQHEPRPSFDDIDEDDLRQVNSFNSFFFSFFFKQVII